MGGYNLLYSTPLRAWTLILRAPDVLVWDQFRKAYWVHTSGRNGFAIPS